MNCRERFHAIMNFEKPDRMYLAEWAPWWDKTMNRWQEEGLVIRKDPELEDHYAVVKQFGLDLMLQYWLPSSRPELQQFFRGEGKGYASDEEGYEKLLPYLYPEPQEFLDVERIKRYKHICDRGDAVMWITLHGYFWWPRTIMGIEDHLYAFYDEPDLMHRINEDICNYHLKVIDFVKQYIHPDFMTFGEDMSYNNGPMLSEKMFDEFMLPYYQQTIPKLKAMGTRVLIDSDGDITKALPWFERAGIEGILPLERQAGVDLLNLRRKHPKCLFLGHYDKMVMPKGEKAMRQEFERLLPIMRQGGFIPSVDHQTPPGVSLENYRIYIRLLKEYAEKI